MNADKIFNTLFSDKDLNNLKIIKEWNNCKFSIGKLSFLASDRVYYLLSYGLFETFLVTDIEENEY